MLIIKSSIYRGHLAIALLGVEDLRKRRLKSLGCLNILVEF